MEDFDMVINECPQCGAPISAEDTECAFCGEKFEVNHDSKTESNASFQQNYYNPYVVGINPAWPLRSKVLAGLLAIFFGGLGIHKFYLEKIGLGIVYLLFFWTCIPSFTGFVESIIYLTSSDEYFQIKNQVRLR